MNIMSADQQELGPMSEEQHRKMHLHRKRCRTLPPLARGEAERLLKSFVEAGGTIKACPARYALPTT
jgi:hypothetical protein